MARTKRVGDEQDGHPHKRQPKRPSKVVMVETSKKKQPKRRSADEQLTQEQADAIIGADKVVRAGCPVRIAKPEAGSAEQRASRRVPCSSHTVAVESEEV